MPDITPADEKALALYYAYAALARTLIKSGVITHDAFMANLAGANQQLLRIGETGAAALLGAMAQNLLAIDE